MSACRNCGTELDQAGCQAIGVYHSPQHCIAALQHALEWEDVADEWSEAIKAAHPVRSGSHDEYGVAMKMVGHRHSKGELVSLVNWLLVSLKKAKYGA
jgi:hypothetical protein